MANKFGNRKYTKAEWRKWKKAQRAYPAGGKNVRRHHASNGKVKVLSPKGHAAQHKKSGTQGGRGKKK